MKIQTGPGTVRRQDIDSEQLLKDLGILAPASAQEEQPQMESILTTGRHAALYNFAFLAGIIVMLIGFSSAIEGSSLSQGWNMDTFLPGVILLVTGLGLGIVGGSGSEYA